MILRFIFNLFSSPRGNAPPKQVHIPVYLTICAGIR